VPGNREEKVYDLLSEGIVNADGLPGKNFARAHQFQIISPPSGGKFFISADKQQKGPLQCAAGTRSQRRSESAGGCHP
jgi:hypothetical protein